MEPLLSQPDNCKPLVIPLLDNDFEFRWGNEFTIRDTNRLQRRLKPELGVDITKIIHGSRRPAASLLQTWLYFGLLSDYFQRPITPELLRQHEQVVTGDDGWSYIQLTQGFVEQLIEGHVKRLSHLSKSSRDGEWHRLTGILHYALENLQIFDQVREELASRDGQPEKLMARVALSVKLLVYNLNTITGFCSQRLSKGALSRLFSSKSSEVPPWTDGPLPTVPVLVPGSAELYSNQELFSLFKESQWCPQRARQILQTQPLLTSMRLARTRLLSSDAADHALCQKIQNGRCVAYQLNDQEVQRHVDGCSGDCGDLLLNTGVLIDFIDKKRIPVLSIDPTNPNWDLKLHDHQGNLTYTAFSHVWSDGLGNRNENSLHNCQVKRLVNILTTLKAERKVAMGRLERFYTAQRKISRTARRESRRVYFWLDTLCIPRRPGDKGMPSARARDAAVRIITPIFSGAAETVILDRELELMSGDGQSDENIAAHLLGSKWPQRAWTLEEGTLSTKCVFKLEGTKLRDFNAKSRFTGVPSPSSVLSEILSVERKSQMRAKIVGFQDEKSLSKTQVSRFVDAWNALIQRSATEPADVYKILASMMDFNAPAVHRLAVSQRLPKIITSCSELPLSLLYSETNRIPPDRPPQDAWIPTYITGSQLHKRAKMKVVRPRSSLDHHQTVRLQINPSGETLDSLLMLCSARLLDLPFGCRLFRVMVDRDTEYVVKVHCDMLSYETGNHLPGVVRGLEHYYEQGERACVIIDKSTGSDMLQGYTGRGVRLSLRPRGSHRGTTACFGGSIMAWSPAQWLANQGCPLNQIPSVDVHPLPSSETVFLETSNEMWKSPLPQRPVLPPALLRPVSITTTIWFILYMAVAIIVVVVVVVTVNPNVDGASRAPIIVCSAVAAFLSLLCARIAMVRYTMWRYKKWLKTFAIAD